MVIIKIEVSTLKSCNDKNNKDADKKLVGHIQKL